MDSKEFIEFEIGKMRVMLKASLAEELWWETLERRNRIGLLRLADINTGLSRKKWMKISPVLRKHIIETALLASMWAKQLLGEEFD